MPDQRSCILSVLFSCFAYLSCASLHADPLDGCQIRYVTPQHQAQGVAINPLFQVGFQHVWTRADCEKQLTLRADGGRVIPLRSVLSAQWQGPGGKDYTVDSLVPTVWLEHDRHYTLSWRGKTYVHFQTGRQAVGRIVSFSPATFPFSWCPSDTVYSPADVVSCLSAINRGQSVMRPIVQEALQSHAGFPFAIKFALARYTSTLPSGTVFVRHAWMIYPRGQHFSSFVILPSLTIDGHDRPFALALALIAAEKGHIVLLPYDLEAENVPGYIRALPDTFDLWGIAHNVSHLISAIRQMPALSSALPERPMIEIYGAGSSSPAALATVQQLQVEGFPIDHIFLSRGLFNVYAEADVQMESLRYGTRSSTLSDKTYFAQPQEFLHFLRKFAWALSYWGILGIADPFYLSDPDASFARDYLMDFPFDDHSAIRGLLADVSLADSSFIYRAPHATVHLYRFHPSSLMFSSDILETLSSARQSLGAVTSTTCHGGDEDCDVLAARDFLRALPMNNRPVNQSDSWDTPVRNQDFSDNQGSGDLSNTDDFDVNDGSTPPAPPSNNTINTVVVVNHTDWDSDCINCRPDPWYHHHHHHHYYPRYAPPAPTFPAQAVYPPAPTFPAHAVYPPAPTFPAHAVYPPAPTFPARPVPAIVPVGHMTPSVPFSSGETVRPSGLGPVSAGSLKQPDFALGKPVTVGQPAVM